MSNKGVLTIISGFSGVGKGTMVKELLTRYDDYALSISATTRNMRPGEVDGESYFFVSREEFEAKIDNNELLEYAQYVDNYYGTPREYVEKMLSEGKNVLLEIEIQGAMQIKKLMPEALTIFIMPPSPEKLKSRLIGRNTETMDVINKRLCRAAEESMGIENYDCILVNDNLEKSVVALNNLIQSERCRTFRNIEFINNIRKGVEVFSEGE